MVLFEDGPMVSSMELWVGIATLAMSIVGSAVGLGFKIGKVEQQLAGLEALLEIGNNRMGKHDSSINALEHRVSTLEGMMR